MRTAQYATLALAALLLLSCFGTGLAYRGLAQAQLEDVASEGDVPKPAPQGFFSGLYSHLAFVLRPLTLGALPMPHPNGPPHPHGPPHHPDGPCDKNGTKNGTHPWGPHPDPWGPHPEPWGPHPGPHGHNHSDCGNHTHGNHTHGNHTHDHGHGHHDHHDHPHDDHHDHPHDDHHDHDDDHHDDEHHDKHVEEHKEKKHDGKEHKDKKHGDKNHNGKKHEGEHERADGPAAEHAPHGEHGPNGDAEHPHPKGMMGKLKDMFHWSG